MPRIYSNWLKAYIDYTAASEAPTQFHFWTAISTVAGALRRKVWTDHKIFKWTPNFYIVFVGKAGIVTKSTTMDLGMNLLEQVEGIHLGPGSATWQGLTTILQAAIEEVKYIDVWGEEQKLQMSAVTLPISELGTFLKMNQEGLPEVLIDLWDNKISKRPFGHVTRTQSEIKIVNPWINIIGCTTPTWLRTNFPEAHVGGGLTSRIIFVFGEKKRHLVAYPERAWKGKDFEQTAANLVSDLKQISLITGEYRLTDEAYTWGTAWYERNWGTRPSHLASDRFEGYIARKQTHMHKLAMVLAAVRSDDLKLDRPHLEEADTILTTAEASMVHVFESIGLVPQAAQIRTIMSWVTTLGTISMQDLWARCINQMNFQDFDAAIKGAIEAKMLKVVIASITNGVPVKGVALP